MINLDLIKIQCRVSTDDDDALLIQYLNASVGLAQNYLSRRIYENEDALNDAGDENGIVINETIKQALLMTISHFYEHREAIVTGITSKAVELGFRALLQPYRIYGL